MAHFPSPQGLSIEDSALRNRIIYLYSPKQLNRINITTQGPLRETLRRQNGSDEVKVNLDKKAAAVKIYDPTMGVNPVNKYKNSDVVTLTLNDHPVVVEL